MKVKLLVNLVISQNLATNASSNITNQISTWKDDTKLSSRPENFVKAKLRQEIQIHK